MTPPVPLRADMLLSASNLEWLRAQAPGVLDTIVSLHRATHLDVDAFTTAVWGYTLGQVTFEELTASMTTTSWERFETLLTVLTRRLIRRRLGQQPSRTKMIELCAEMFHHGDAGEPPIPDRTIENIIVAAFNGEYADSEVYTRARLMIVTEIVRADPIMQLKFQRLVKDSLSM